MYHKNGIYMVIIMLAFVFVWEYMVYADAKQDRNGFENESGISGNEMGIKIKDKNEIQQYYSDSIPAWNPKLPAENNSGRSPEELSLYFMAENNLINLTRENSQVMIEKNIGVASLLECKILVKHYKYSISEAEREMLERIVEAEACGEDIDGKKLVANVVLNRVQNKAFPNSIEEVIFQKDGGVYQFSPIYDGRYYSVSVSEESKEAVEEVLLGEDNSEGALYFMSRNYADSDKAKWFDRHLTKLFAYGGHEFFR